MKLFWGDKQLDFDIIVPESDKLYMTQKQITVSGVVLCVQVLPEKRGSGVMWYASIDPNIDDHIQDYMVCCESPQAALDQLYEELEAIVLKYNSIMQVKI